ncbi:hypothetical protein HC864_05990 [Candidatus Gracilibacteria bacterium]|nr:hypothetical protein [Candidatus Gracilibacteria bacterium]
MPSLFEKHFLSGQSEKTNKSKSPKEREKETRRIKYEAVINSLRDLEKKGLIDSGKFNSFMVSQISERKTRFYHIPVGDFEEIFNFLYGNQGMSRPLSFETKFKNLINQTELGNKYRLLLLDGMTKYIKDIAIREKPAISNFETGEYSKKFKEIVQDNLFQLKILGDITPDQDFDQKKQTYYSQLNNAFSEEEVAETLKSIRKDKDSIDQKKYQEPLSSGLTRQPRPAQVLYGTELITSASIDTIEPKINLIKNKIEKNQLKDLSKEKLIKYINEMYLPNVSGSGKAQEYWSKFGKWIEYNLQKSSDVDFFDSIVKLTGNIKHDMAKNSL